jgi:DNA-binding HxlR family transcriptional regulator
MLAAPLNVPILLALADGPRQQAELRRSTGLPAQTTLRAQLKRLGEIGAIEKHRHNSFPGVLKYELTASGRELVFVASVLERWLEEAPDGPLPIGGNGARAAVKALAQGWSTTMLRALAARPLSLTELDGVITSLSYPSLERRLAALRLAGLIEAGRRTAAARGTPYAITRWLRRGVAPVVVAARWERRNLPDTTAPIAYLDAETAFLLAAPLLQAPEELRGSCRLAAEIQNGRKRRLAGVIVTVEGGAIESCTTSLDGKANAWALGSAAAWLDTVIEGDADGLELGGDGGLARALLEGLHAALFSAHPAIRP